MSRIQNVLSVHKAVMELQQPLTVVRARLGTYDAHGRAELQEPITMMIQAVIQPATGKELERLEDGQRTREAIVIFTTDVLRTASRDGRTQADLVDWNGHLFQVQNVEDWDSYGHYRKVTAVAQA